MKERNLWNDPEQDGSVRYWKASGRPERVGNKFERKHIGKVGEIGDLSSIDPYKTETMMEEE